MDWDTNEVILLAGGRESRAPAQKGTAGYIVAAFADGHRQTEWPNLLLDVKRAKVAEPAPKGDSSDETSVDSEGVKKDKKKKKKGAMKTAMKAAMKVLKRPAGTSLQA